MSQLPFIHLRMHSEFSVTDSIIRLPEAVNKAVHDQMPALAVTDKMSLFGLVRQYNACRNKGVQPIIGVDFHYTDPKFPGRKMQMVLLAKNKEGYLWISRLLTRAFTKPYKEEILASKEDILSESPNGNVVALSGGFAGDVGQLLHSGEHESAFQTAEEWKTWFDGDYYLEVQRVEGKPEYENVVQKSLWTSSELGIPVVATHPIQFMEREDFKYHELRTCIAEKYTLDDPNRPRVYTEDQYFKTQEEMKALFADIPEAIENTAKIAMKCNTSLTLGKNFLPQFPTPEGMTLDDYLSHLSYEGLEKRLAQLYPDELRRDAERPRYTERLQFEINTICQMGFPGYFLIVQDFINWAKNNGCPVGPGRGSGAGSLVAYSLGITDLDPLEYSLLFERFLNPERVSMPDFDIDFCQNNRGRVIDYVRHKYGEAAVSQIATFGTMASRAVVKDVGRALNQPYYYCDSLSKLIPNAPGKEVSLSEALEIEPELERRVKEEEDAKNIFDGATKLEGLVRSIGMHAGGVLISPSNIDDFCPMYQSAGLDSVPVSMLDKDDVEKIGLVKFDFLGLKNLTIIDLAVDFIKKNHPDMKDFNIHSLPYTDADTYQILKDGNTTAVFQVESDGMKKLMIKLQPDCFEDIIAVLALYRPGPLGSGMVDSFIDRKAGKEEIDYYDDDLKDCLSPTYGVIVYQEQVMQISQIMGGYTLGAADMLRRAMGKKKPEEMAQHRGIFKEGALNKGKSPELAEKLFDLMAMFAEYGFNKSHTAAYAVVTYQTAWLKAHYPAEFYAATMSIDMGNTENLRIYYDDARNNNIVFLPPSINASKLNFDVVNPSTIRYGLGALKGLGEDIAKEIEKERLLNGPYLSMEDFCIRLPKKMMNKKTLTSLIGAGAFDEFGLNRTTLMSNMVKVLQWADVERTNAQTKQGGLFDMFEESNTFEYKSFDDVHIEKMDWEYKAIGFYISDHPFRAYAEEFKKLTQLSHLQPGDKSSVIVAGWITQLDVKVRQDGKIGYFTFEDGQVSYPASAFKDAMSANGHILKDNMPLIVEASLRLDKETGMNKLIVSRMWDLHSARQHFARLLRVDNVNKEVFETIRPILRKYADMAKDNHDSVYVDIVKTEGDQTLAAFAEPIYLHPKCIEELETVHPGCISFEW